VKSSDSMDCQKPLSWIAALNSHPSSGSAYLKSLG
jgi:hypothetical protein